MVCVFFFQAEDGIRDYKVTGVQTCALPILSRNMWGAGGPERRRPSGFALSTCQLPTRYGSRSRSDTSGRTWGERSPEGEPGEIGRASGRGRGEISVVAGSFKKKKRNHRRSE